ncbi:eukaryotic translation initiation factor 3 subunit B-like [Antedon mediterranea]|uniref:eukaryotic translation initiation factor 3 subunit B-like n=1 Tax=Antedon mediterranea TaxID=105859 RepID=UPI003AF766B6
MTNLASMQNNDDPSNERVQEPDFDDPPGFVDDISNEELLADLLKDKPKEADGIDSVVVIDNVPSVGPERLEKLKNVINKIFSKFGQIVSDHYPLDNGKTMGYIFLEYKSPANAVSAVKMLNGYKLDKQHTFAVNLFTDFEKYANRPPSQNLEKRPFQDMGNLRSWLQDIDANDHYSVIHDAGEKTSIYLNTSSEAIKVEERARWTETYVRWSPQGTYLTTFHQKGIALWGGEKFQQIQRFAHTGVQLIDFSPCERYLVSFSPLMDSKDDPKAIIIWDVLTGAKKRGFHCLSTSQWPVFKWSHDGKYFARIGEDSLSVYETPSFGLLDKKSFKCNDIKDFCWSPADSIISYWVPEQGESPARVTLLEIPSRKELRVKNLFNVSECKLHWQKAGDYLGVKVDRLTKSKKGQYYSFEIFRIREKQIPVDVVEIKDPIGAFAWEPVGSRFAVLHGESPRIGASFYNVKPNSKIELITTLEKKAANALFWAPNGQFIVLAGLRSMNGALEFVDANDMTIMNTSEHFMATDVEWDPTGRYVATGVSWWSHKVDNAYWMWSFQGKVLQKCTTDRFCQLLWRPRPPPVLTEEQIKDLKKNMKTYSKRYELKDRMSQSKASKEIIERRRVLMEEFENFKKQKEEQLAAEKKERLELRRGMETDSYDSGWDEVAQETVEFFISEEIIEIEDPE